MSGTRSKRHILDNNLAVYLRDINRIPMLTREEEKKTARAAAAGNKAARDRLVNANLRFVVNVAKKYQGLGLSLEDLIGEGNAGLLNAVNRFDVEKGYHFISYAVWWIRQAIMSALCDKARMIRLPSNRAAQLVKIEKAGKIVRNNSSASVDEEIADIAELLNMEKKNVRDLLTISQEILSLDIPVSGDRNSVFGDFIEDRQYVTPDNAAEQQLMKEDIDNVLDTLNKDEADIIRCHYGLGRKQMSLKEIGARYNLSKERIRQIEERALSRLRNPKRAGRLQAYVA
jgi:RNA polymerase primary sigma factor